MSNVEPLVLIVEDDPQLRKLLRASLTGNGYRVVETETAAQAVTQAATRNPDVVVLDLGLPDQDGLEVTRRLREWSNVPIIVLSARDRLDDKVLALDYGADDYLTKPFAVPELLARIRVALRHRDRERTGSTEAVLAVGDLSIDLSQRQVAVAGKEVKLTPTEYNLLLVLMRHAGKVVTHLQLLKEAWGPAYTEQRQYLHVYIGQLRRKIEAVPARPRLLLTEPGVGYRLRAD